jgi:hypothetical protein
MAHIRPRGAIGTEEKKANNLEPCADMLNRRMKARFANIPVTCFFHIVIKDGPRFFPSNSSKNFGKSAKPHLL